MHILHNSPGYFGYDDNDHTTRQPDTEELEGIDAHFCSRKAWDGKRLKERISCDDCKSATSNVSSWPFLCGIHGKRNPRNWQQSLAHPQLRCQPFCRWGFACSQTPPNPQPPPTPPATRSRVTHQPKPPPCQSCWMPCGAWRRGYFDGRRKILWRRWLWKAEGAGLRCELLYCFYLVQDGAKESKCQSNPKKGAGWRVSELTCWLQGSFVWACAHAAPGIFLRSVPNSDIGLWAAILVISLGSLRRQINCHWLIQTSTMLRSLWGAGMWCFFMDFWRLCFQSCCVTLEKIDGCWHGVPCRQIPQFQFSRGFSFGSLYIFAQALGLVWMFLVVLLAVMSVRIVLLGAY